MDPKQVSDGAGAATPRPGLIHHSDQGIQYTSGVYQVRLHVAGLIPILSHKGNCFDNAVVESFFSTLKN